MFQPPNVPELGMIVADALNRAHAESEAVLIAPV